MKTVITIRTSEGTSVTIFTSHIAYIEHAAQGCIIYVNTGGQNVSINTDFTWEELVTVLEKD